MSTALKVWSWWGRDSSSLEDLVFVVACATRGELQKVSVRCRLPSPKTAGRLKPSERGFNEAMEQPGALLWMELDDWAAGNRQWPDEEGLLALRAEERARPSGGGQGRRP